MVERNHCGFVRHLCEDGRKIRAVGAIADDNEIDRGLLENGIVTTDHVDCWQIGERCGKGFGREHVYALAQVRKDMKQP